MDVAVDLLNIEKDSPNEEAVPVERIEGLYNRRRYNIEAIVVLVVPSLEFCPNPTLLSIESTIPHYNTTLTPRVTCPF